MPEIAGVWQRVSTAGQDEANQLPDIMRWIENHGYDHGPTYTLHGKSASKGRQQRYLDQVIRDMEDGKINVLVVWQSSRIERRGAWNAFDLARRVRDAGGRIEYVQDSYLNETNEMSDVMLALAATKDRQKSQDISKQIKAKHARLRDTGSAIGPPPFGYRVEGAKDNKHFVPTDVGRAYVPVIFQMVIDGESTRTIARYLTEHEVPNRAGKPWNEGFIGNRLIRNPIYYGQRRNAGNLQTEALVSPTTWQQANTVLRSRNRSGRAATVNHKPLLRPVCGACYQQIRPGCSTGESQMYRIWSGSNRNRRPYYRCTGAGPQRTGCGAPMIPTEQLDDIVTQAMLANIDYHYARVFVPGDTNANEIARLDEDGATAMRQGDYDLAMQKMAQAKRLREIPAVAPHWELQITDQTEADYFDSLDIDERREYLATKRIIASIDPEDGLPKVAIMPKDLQA